MSFHSKQIEFGILEDVARRIRGLKSSGWSGSRNDLKTMDLIADLQSQETCSELLIAEVARFIMAHYRREEVKELENSQN